MNVWNLIRQRIWGLILVSLGVCVITFVISHLIPGDPARLLAGERASDAMVAHIRHQLGLDQPLLYQFYHYLVDLLHGDLGNVITSYSIHYTKLYEGGADRGVHAGEDVEDLALAGKVAQTHVRQILVHLV